MSYFVWRRQEAAQPALDRFCTYVLGREKQRPDTVTAILQGLGDEEKIEILRQNGVEYGGVPAWQRQGTAVFLRSGAERVTVETALPPEEAYVAYLQGHLG